MKHAAGLSAILVEGSERMNAKSKLDPKWFTDAGYFPLPIIPPGAPLSTASKIDPAMLGKIPGLPAYGGDGAWRGMPDWNNRNVSLSLLECCVNDGAGIGIRLAGQVGVDAQQGRRATAVDVDITDPMIADEIETLITAQLGLAPKRVGRAPKALLLYRREFAHAKVRIALTVGDQDWAVEFLGDGQQFVAQGLHPKTGSPYTWPRPLLPYAALPAITRQQLERTVTAVAAFLRDVFRGVDVHVTGDLDGAAYAPPKADGAALLDLRNVPNPERFEDDIPLLKSALAALKPQAHKYDLWFELGCALYHASGDSDVGFELWHEFSKDAPNYPGFDALAAKWDTAFRRAADRPQVRLGTVFWHAEQAGWDRRAAWREIQDAKLVPLADLRAAPERLPAAPDGLERLLDVPEDQGGEKTPPEGATQAAGASAENLLLVVGGQQIVTRRHVDVMAGYTPPGFLIEDLIHAGGVVFLVGPTSSAKTTIILRLGAHYMTGIEFDGRAINNPERRTALFLCADDFDGTVQRLQALRESMAWDGAPEPLVESDPFGLTLTAVKGLVEYVERNHVGLIIVDTSAVYTAVDAEENSASDMQEKLTAARMVAGRTGATVVLVAHPNEAARKDNDPLRFLPRGSSALAAAADAVLTVHDPAAPSGGGDTRDLHWVKFRGDGSKFQRIAFQLHKVRLRSHPEVETVLADTAGAAAAFDAERGVTEEKAALIALLVTAQAGKNASLTAAQIAQWLHAQGKLASASGDTSENKPLRAALDRAVATKRVKSIGQGRGREIGKADQTNAARDAAQQTLAAGGLTWEL
jgi:hypothetical protein